MASADVDKQEQDDCSFLRTNDFICLSCVAGVDNQVTNERVALAAEGFGNRNCFVEPLNDKRTEPPDLSVCAFVLEQALSVRALQEMVSASSQGEQTQAGGSRTLLYGHAILLRHLHSDMYLSCLSSSSSGDKLAFDVGLTETSGGESCWWTIHPASKQRSEGEKVRVGDDFILVSVASERYLTLSFAQENHIGGSNAGGAPVAFVIASFQQTLWTVVPVSAGGVRQKSLGYVFGGDVLRFFHGDECLTLTEADGESTPYESVMYETGSVCSQARSLWRLQHVRTKWSSGFVGVSNAVRIRHVTTGRFLAVKGDGQVVTVYRTHAGNDSTVFFLRETKDEKKALEEEEEGMGSAEIKYGESVLFVQHAATGLWLSYQTFETKKRGIGRVEVKQSIMLVEGHMDDGFTFTRAQEEESRSALIIRKCQSLLSRFNKGLAALKKEGNTDEAWIHISLGEVLKCLQDQIAFFSQPAEDEPYEERQNKLHALRNRQNLFQEEGMIALVLATIDQFSMYKTQRHFVSYAGEEAGNFYADISSYLYLLLASMIRGNRANCAQFAQTSRLDWLVDRLESQQTSSSRGVLEVLHCVLIDSPEALTMIKETHIRSIIALIDKHGRDSKVLEVLCSLCVGNGVAVRSNQNLICDNLLPSRDLLLQTKVVDSVTSMRPNIFVGLNEGAAMFRRWYYEVVVDHSERLGSGTGSPHLRVGWASVDGYAAYPGSGRGWGGNGVGDDLFSYGYDGSALWTDGRNKKIRSSNARHLQKGDVVGCCLDLSIPSISFTLNGTPLRGLFKDFNIVGMFFPVISLSTKVSCRFMLGGEHGRLRYGPPEGHAPVYESLLPQEKLSIQPAIHFGDVTKGILHGPSQVGEHQMFVPNPIDTSHIQLPSYIESIRDKLAENIHELWAMGKIEQGWTFGENRDDAARKHPCLTSFERLPASERQYDITLAFETFRTLLSLGYHISVDNVETGAKRMKTMKLPSSHLQSNGYKPTPLDLGDVHLNDKLRELVEQLAENTHNVWARDRIRQGWTYGQSDDTANRRSCHLVPYSKVADAIKKANRETASETIRTLLAYGYTIEPPSPESSDGMRGLSRQVSETRQTCRIFRAARDYAVTCKKWYYEFEVVTSGAMRVGWARADIRPQHDIGSGADAYMFDGFLARKWHSGSAAYGKTWQEGDVIGCLLDLSNHSISFSLNGELMMDLAGQEIAFKDIEECAYLPVIMLGLEQKAAVNFGQDAHSLKYFTCCGMQEGYEPYCVNMTRPMPLWFLKNEGVFEPIIGADNCDIAISRGQGSGSSTPSLRISSASYGTLGSTTQVEYVRLSLPIKLNEKYTSRLKSSDASDPGDVFRPPTMNGFHAPAGADLDESQRAMSEYVRRYPRKITTSTSSSNVGNKLRMSFRKTLTRSFNEEDGLSQLSPSPGPFIRGHSVEEPPQSEDMFSDSNLITENGSIKSSGRKSGRSPFNFFKKSRSRDTSPGRSSPAPGQTPAIIQNGKTLIHPGGTPSSYGGTPSLTRSSSRPPLVKQGSEVSCGSGTADLSPNEIQYLEAHKETIDDYFYGVRILPGQDPNVVFVGWFTSAYSTPAVGGEFNLRQIHHVNLGQVESATVIKTSLSRKECYMVCAGELLQRSAGHDGSGEGGISSGTRQESSGILIGCTVNVNSGKLTFSLNGKETAQRYQVEPGTRLFPGVVYEPTVSDVLQFEIGRTRSALPLSSHIFRGGKQVTPECPSRLTLQYLKPSQWSRVPDKLIRVHRMKLSDVKGWSMLSEEPASMIAVNIPEENRCLDILELGECPEMLKFHAKTLDLYTAVCSHGNHRAAHEIIQHVDKDQLLHAIQCQYMPGPLRMGFHNLLIELHLEYHSNFRLRTQNEFIFPIFPGESETEDYGLYADVDEGAQPIWKTIPTVEDTKCIRPKLTLVEADFAHPNGSAAHMTSPLFPLDILKRHSIRALTEAVQKGGAHIRDPLGGSNSHLFVPILRVLDRLLVMGLLTDVDMKILLRLIDPTNFTSQKGQAASGLLQMSLSEAVKLELCKIFHHICDCQIRSRVEKTFAFSTCFVRDLQGEQLKRYKQITSTPLPPAVAARKTKEFRCSPQDQMTWNINFREEAPEGGQTSMVSEGLQDKLKSYYTELLQHSALFAEDDGSGDEPPPPASFIFRLLGMGGSSSSTETKDAATKGKGEESEEAEAVLCDTIQQLLAQTVTKWARETIIEDQVLVREIFSLLHRQHNGVGELLDAFPKTYVISEKSEEDICHILKPLGNIRTLLAVQVSTTEEEILKNSLKDIMDNKVFFQHPDLMRALCVHETSMQLMVQTLTKATEAEDNSEMVVMCCRFLCYFCRTSTKNQRAMFEHLSYLLANSAMLLSRPSLRGSCPLDVAYSSLMDNNELALALRESHLERIVAYLSRAGVQSNPDLLARGYPDIGWDPVEGERFLDFLRFCVWVNGESVEENANLIVRLLIRRPECLGPALRGESGGGGLLKAMKYGITMSEQIASSKDDGSTSFIMAMSDADDIDKQYLHQSKYDFSCLPSSDDEDYIDMGGAILNFYATLVDLLGRCAPNEDMIKQGKNHSVRARAILRSLVTMDDLEGVLNLRFLLPVMRLDQPMPPVLGLLPEHKAAMLLFLERVYGIENQTVFFRLLENGFLPDLRAATTLDTAKSSESDIALALNRYLCGSVLPLLTKHAFYFENADYKTQLLNSLLHTVYRLSKCTSLTAAQFRAVSEFLVALTSYMRPMMMTKLLKLLTVDLPSLTDNTVISIRMLTHHYERCSQYYGSKGSPEHGAATEEEKKLTMILFTRLFDALATRAYDPDLFTKALPCLAAIGCALSPDYALSQTDDSLSAADIAQIEQMSVAEPVDFTKVHLSSVVDNILVRFAEHAHEVWASKKAADGWVFGDYSSEESKTHPNMLPFDRLGNKEQRKYFDRAAEIAKATMAMGWTLDYNQSRSQLPPSSKKKVPSTSMEGETRYNPRPTDLKSITLPREVLVLIEKLSENAHNLWARRKKAELDKVGGGVHALLVPFESLTEDEKVLLYSGHITDLFKFLQTNGFRAARRGREGEGDGTGGLVGSSEKRFAFSLLEKLLQYVDKAGANFSQVVASEQYTRKGSFSHQNEEIKFFGRVVLPLVEKYFEAHQDYFVCSSGLSVGCASVKEKEMVACLFCKLASLLRQKLSAFGSDINITVRCLVVLIQAVDARSVVKNCPEIIRSLLFPFFHHCAEDASRVVSHLRQGRFSHVKGTVTRGATSLDYVHMVLLPVLTSLFTHLGAHGYGSDLLIDDIQVACYRILNALYSIGTHSDQFVQRHRPALGECVAGFASCFPVAFLEPHLNKNNRSSVLFGVDDDKIAEVSLETSEIMTEMGENVPVLEAIVKEIAELAESGGNYQEAPHIIEVTLPMLCSYLPVWWSLGPDNVTPNGTPQVTAVTTDLMNTVLGNVLKLIDNNIGAEDAPWMNRIAMRTQPIIANAKESLLKEYILPTARKLSDKVTQLKEGESHYMTQKRANAEDTVELEEQLTLDLQVMVRDMYAFLPVLIRFVDLYRSQWIKSPTKDTELLFEHVAAVFIHWTKSNLFKRAENTFVSINGIDNLALIMPSQKTSSRSGKQDVAGGDGKKRKKGDKRRKDPCASLAVASIKRLMPIGLNIFEGQDQELVQMTKERLIEREPEIDIEDLLKVQVQLEEKASNSKQKWQKALYVKMGKSAKLGEAVHQLITQTAKVERILNMGRVLFGLHMVEHPLPGMAVTWKKVISYQRKKAVMACFRMLPIYNLHRHRAINLFISAFSQRWLGSEVLDHTKLIEELTSDDGETVAEDGPDPLRQYISCLSRQAQTHQSGLALPADLLYINYVNIMSESCSGGEEEDEGGEEEALSFQEQEMQKQKLLFEQGRLSNRCTAEMLLYYISSSKGVPSDMVTSTINCGIALLLGGNKDVQQKMLDHLKLKKDVGFFSAIAGLMQQCSVLDLDAFERCNKAEDLGVASESTSGAQNLYGADFTIKLFRFIQLLCEGHNAGWQNYLRSQAGNNTTVNLIVSTVDYLLRIQESIMDFYWHYSSKDGIDAGGKRNFLCAIRVANQVFASLTEFIQGPCAGNQLTLAHSRLWDAVGGFLFIFAHMQDKLSRDPDQLELLREFMGLQKEMMIMLLSMLEGNVMNGPIGKQMVDTLVDSSANFEMILKFFDIFLKMKGMTTSEAFMEYDTNKDGYISAKEFRKAMLSNKLYSREEIDYIMRCVDANQDGKVDFLEFTERFHNPAKDIGFNVALLLTNLSEHMPNDPRLERFLEKAKCVLDYFEPYLGRIEIMGSSGRIERVYFEITQSHIDQWEKPQIKDSKRSFLFSVVNEGDGDNEKIESFVNFCEDSIFEMQHASSISAEELGIQLAQAKAAQALANKEITGGVWENTKAVCGHAWEWMWFLLTLLSISNIQSFSQTVRAMTVKQILVAVLKGFGFLIKHTILLSFKAVWLFFKWIMVMMMGEPRPEYVKEAVAALPPAPAQPTNHQPLGAPGDQPLANGDAGHTPNGDLDSGTPSDSPTATTFTEEAVPPQEPTPAKSDEGGEKEKGEEGESDEVPYETKSFDYGRYIISIFARNFYNFKMFALVVAFMINFLLLFFKVQTMVDAVAVAAVEEGEDAPEPIEFSAMEEDKPYLAILIRLLAIMHTLTSLSVVIAYYFLKVPLVIFKHEKSIARKLEFEGMWVAEEPSGDDLRARWDKMVLNTHSFPYFYWDKFVKKKVRNKYSEQYDFEVISKLLGMDMSNKVKFDTDVTEKKTGILPAFLADIDWKYQLWKWGAMFTDNSFLYLSCYYLLFSIIGNFNYFFFAAHLMDVAISFKTLGTILQSVTHNGKQLMLTVILTSIVVYIYTVIAFNFFRKFYIKEDEDGQEAGYKCHDMLTCFIFHMYVGVRAGGGIGDEIGSPDGDPSEVYRILFDITFFFFVIVILLAIIQGLIIDAFGELRSQLEQVKEDMESSCFICGIGKDYFDSQPHGFETHVMKEHNFANYMFFLMHLINKPDTEYTGQETYVWEMYQNRCWDFFPVGDCFRKQYDTEDAAGS